MYVVVLDAAENILIGSKVNQRKMKTGYQNLVVLIVPNLRTGRLADIGKAQYYKFSKYSHGTRRNVIHEFLHRV